MIQRARRKRLKIRNLTRNPDFSVRLSIFRVFRSCSNQNTRSTFLYFIFYIEKDTKPIKKRRENRSWAQWAMLARPTIFFPLLLGWVQFLSFLILMILRRLDRLQFKPELPLLFWVFRKVFRSCSNQNISLYFSFLFLYFIARKNRIQSRFQ